MGVLARKMEEEYTGRTEHLDKTRTKAHALMGDAFD